MLEMSRKNGGVQASLFTVSEERSLYFAELDERLPSPKQKMTPPRNAATLQYRDSVKEIIVRMLIHSIPSAQKPRKPSQDISAHE